MKKILLLLPFLATLVFSCKKDDPEPDNKQTQEETTQPEATAALVSEGLTFNQSAYFATDGSMKAPVDSNTAKTIASKIDITFFFNYDYTEPGFLDPVTRSKEWYWDEYQTTWSAGSVETRLYSTKITESQFIAAKTDQAKIGTYFSDTSNVKLAPHSIFPKGSCIGGRQTTNPTSVDLGKGKVYGFQNIKSGKRGLIFIRNDQGTGWPMPFFDFNTKVDIIREQ
jgi:hypothetical protein